MTNVKMSNDSDAVVRRIEEIIAKVMHELNEIHTAETATPGIVIAAALAWAHFMAANAGGQAESDTITDFANIILTETRSVEDIRKSMN